jgi:hypothetical protein
MTVSHLQSVRLPRMTLIPIQVESPSGSKADERSRQFVWDARVIEVREVVDRWYQVESLPEWPRADYFKVQSEDGSQYLLKHDLESEGTLVKRGSATG